MQSLLERVFRGWECWVLKGAEIGAERKRGWNRKKGLIPKPEEVCKRGARRMGTSWTKEVQRIYFPEVHGSCGSPGRGAGGGVRAKEMTDCERLNMGGGGWGGGNSSFF